MSVLTIIPITSEKAYASALTNVYAFKVPLGANKQQVAQAVEAQYGVTVINIKSLIQNGKSIAFSKGKRARPGRTTRRDIKKAYVTLAKGDSIKIFDESETEKAASSPTKKDAVASTQSKPTTKLRAALQRGAGRGGDR